MIQELPEPEPDEEVPVFRPEEDEGTFEIEFDGEAYHVVGKRIERAAAMTYWEYDEAILRFHRILEALGIADALEEAGVQPGDTVTVSYTHLRAHET